ncbi:telomere-associated protein RIF1 [Biomphalaria glabrata]|nr:telomere-associated protein RIF1-like [Biomphalaria glabrata]
MSLSDIIQKVTSCNSTDIEAKNAAYKTLYGYLKSDSLKKGELQANATQIVSAATKDVLLSDSDTVMMVLEVLLKCLTELNLQRPGGLDLSQVLQVLLDRARKYISPEVTILLLRCLNQQIFLSDQIITEILAILNETEEKNLTTLQFALLVEEAVELIYSLERQNGDILRVTASSWAYYTIPALGSPSNELREKAFSLINKYLDSLMDFTPLSKRIIKCLNIGMAVSLKKLMLKDPLYVINVWILLIKLVGKEIHKGSTINAMLEIIEIGFKSSPEIRLKAFVAWRSLIDNFALDEKVISDPKRINLLMLVLKIDNAKRVDVAKEKLLTWWHFAICLGSRLLTSIEQIVYPLVQFCTGISSNAKLGSSNSNKLSSPKSGNLVTVFPAIQKLGLEVLAHILGKMETQSTVEQYQWTLEAPKFYDATSLNFVRHAPFILSSLQDLLDSIGQEADQSLLLYIWTNLSFHIKTALETNSSPKSREVFSNFLNVLHSVVHQEKVKGETVLKFIIKICDYFPQKVLSATSYNIVGKGATLKACPAQLLIEILLTPSIFNTFKSQSNCITLFSKLMSDGARNTQGALHYIQSIAEMLTAQAALLQQELLGKLWIELAQILHNHLIETNEVNQGDALDHNFNCMYAILVLPFKHQLADGNQSKTLTKVWKELYQTFARLSALVPTAEANICMEQMCSMLTAFSSSVTTLSKLDFWVTTCCQMMELADFTLFSNKQLLSSGVFGASLHNKRKIRPLGHFHSIIVNLAELQTKTIELVSSHKGSVKNVNFKNLVSSIFDAQFETYSTLFSRIDGNSFIQQCFEFLAKPLSELFKYFSLDISKSFQTTCATKLEKLWRELGLCLTSRYSGPLDTEFLSTMAQLLQVNFMHTNCTIQNEAVALWNSTFGNLSSLTYPDSLNSVLTKIKEKKTIKLLGHGWIPCDENAVIAETPFSEMNMDELPIPTIMPSPKQQKGSLLNKDLSPARVSSPNSKASPVRVVNHKNLNLLSSAKKNIALEFMSEDDFVVINSPSTKKKRVLTEHQKEVLKEKRVLPAMYNNLDASQDIFLGAHFITDTQHDTESTVDNLTDKSTTQSDQQDAKATFHESTVNKSNSVSRRSSVRIKDINNFAALSSEINQEKSSSDNLDSKIQKETKRGAFKKSAQDKKESLLKVEIEANPELNSEDSGKKAEISSSFGILKLETKNSNESGISLSQDSSLSAISKPDLKTSLRKVQSQDESKSDDLKNSEVEKIKPPRRVPLKKISELNNKTEKVALENDNDESPTKSTRRSAKSKSFNTPHSARKLFSDSKHDSLADCSHGTEVTEKVAAPTNEMESSQGFSTDTAINLKEQVSVESPEDLPCVIPESENLFSSSLEANNFSLELMPTLMSPSEMVPNISKDVKSSVEESSTTSSGDGSGKLVSSSESSFNPSQSTLTEDNSFKQIRKRKSQVPKKYSPEGNLERRGRRKRISLDVKDLSSQSVLSETKKVKRKEVLMNAPEISKSKAVIQPDEQLDDAKKDSETVFTKLIDDISPKIGEVTPDVKSPSVANPTQRRYTAVKRKGRLSKRLARESTSHSLHGLESVASDNSESDELLTKSDIKRKKNSKESSPYRIKRKYTRKSVSPKLQQMMKLKLRAARRLTSAAESTSPPKKRKLNADQLDLSDDDAPLIVTKRALQANQKTEKNCCLVNPMQGPSTSMNSSFKSQLIDDALTNALSQISASVKNTSAHAGTDLSHSATSSNQVSPNLVPTLEHSATSIKQISVSPSAVATISTSNIAPLVEHSGTSINQNLSESLTTANEGTNQPDIDLASLPLESKYTKTNEMSAVTDKTDILKDSTENVIKHQEITNTSYEIQVPSDSTVAVKQSKENSFSSPILKENSEKEDAVSLIDIVLPSESVPESKHDVKKESVSACDVEMQESNSWENELDSNITISDCSSKNEPVTNIENTVTTTEFSHRDPNLKSMKINNSMTEVELPVHSWSPSKSPNCSILKKSITETPPSAQNRRVSFAEPVVSGSSPVGEKYHIERLCNSTPREGSKARTSLFSRQLMRSLGSKRKFEASPRKLTWDKNLDSTKNVESNSQSQTALYKATQESQLNNTAPIFPDLVDCKKPLDDILPQLTSSFWYRGLCQLMKGRNLNTIGDLCSLTELQINQLPFRTPKVQTVKTTLTAYMNHHGLSKTKSVPLEDIEKDTSQDAAKCLSSSSDTCTTSAVMNEDESIPPVPEIEADSKRNQESQSPLLAGCHKILTESRESALRSLTTSELFEIQTIIHELMVNVSKEIKHRLVN